MLNGKLQLPHRLIHRSFVPWRFVTALWRLWSFLVVLAGAFLMSLMEFCFPWPLNLPEAGDRLLLCELIPLALLFALPKLSFSWCATCYKNAPFCLPAFLILSWSHFSTVYLWTNFWVLFLKRWLFLWEQSPVFCLSDASPLNRYGFMGLGTPLAIVVTYLSVFHISN